MNALCISNCMYSYIFKFILIGNSETGKSSFLNCCINNKFSPDTESTIGIEFGYKIFDFKYKKDGKSYSDTVKVQIWDTAGQERFLSVSSSYYRGTICAIFLYDITNRKSFNDVEKWLRRFDDKCEELQTRFIAIAGNKLDLAQEEREIQISEGADLAKRISANYFTETSCRNGKNVEKLVRNCAYEIYKMIIDKNITIASEMPGIRFSDTHYYKGLVVNRYQPGKLSFKKCCHS